MQQAKILAIFEEFGFLNRYADPFRVGRVVVRLMDHELAEAIPVTPELATFNNASRRFYLIDNEGNQIGEEVHRSHLGYLTFMQMLTLLWERPIVRGEKVLEAIRHRDATRKIRYIVDVEDGEHKPTVHIHRIPKGFDVNSWLVETVRREREQLQQDFERNSFLLELDLTVYRGREREGIYTIRSQRPFASAAQVARAVLDLVQPGLHIGCSRLDRGEPVIDLPPISGGYGADIKIQVHAVRAIY
jgi:hypothetical protein